MCSSDLTTLDPVAPSTLGALAGLSVAICAAWTFDSRHYRIKSDLPDAEARRIGAHLDLVFDACAGAFKHLRVSRTLRFEALFFTDPLEYEKFRNAYTLDLKVLEHAREDVTILHPLPRVTEIAPEVDMHPKAAYFRQAHYGVAVRKALLALILGEAEKVLG